MAACAQVQDHGHASAVERLLVVGETSLFVREVGDGPSILVLHGGPDFDHEYLAPDLDSLADAYRVIYFDQRGRGRSAHGVRPESVSLASDIDDIDAVRRGLGITRPVVLGHSWGAILAMEYAVRHPSQVSALVLMNPAPISAEDLAFARDLYGRRLGRRTGEQKAILASDAYQRGEPTAVAARYRIHFAPAIKRADDLERMTARMQAGFIRQGSDGILKARAVEDRLMSDTWNSPGYDLRERLGGVRVPTLVIAGDYDFMARSAVVIGSREGSSNVDGGHAQARHSRRWCKNAGPTSLMGGVLPLMRER